MVTRDREAFLSLKSSNRIERRCLASYKLNNKCENQTHFNRPHMHIKSKRWQGFLILGGTLSVNAY